MDKHPFPQYCPQEVFGATNENQVNVVEWMIFVEWRFEIVLQFHSIESWESMTAIGGEYSDYRSGDRGGEERKREGREDTLSLFFWKVQVSHRCEQYVPPGERRFELCVR